MVLLKYTPLCCLLVACLWVVNKATIEEEGYLLPTIARKITADVSTECSSRHQGESEGGANKTLLFIATLLRIHVIGGQRSVRIATCILSSVAINSNVFVCTSFTFALMTTGAFSRNVGKLFSEL